VVAVGASLRWPNPQGRNATEGVPYKRDMPLHKWVESFAYVLASDSLRASSALVGHLLGEEVELTFEVGQK
jgi:hypothetical protein